MQRNSLAGVSISNRMSELHDPAMDGHKTGPDHVVYVYPVHDLRFVGRYCTVKGKRSGGYVIKAALNERYDHESGLIKWLVTRLNKGWTPVTKQRAIHRMFRKLVDSRTLKRHRELVYKIAESHDLDLDVIDKLEVAENHTIAYEDMTAADCLFWEVELTKFPIKKAPD